MPMSIKHLRFTLACVVLGLVMGLPSIALAQMAGAPFTCDASLYVVIGNNNGSTPISQLYRVNRGTTPFTFDPIGPPTTSSEYPHRFSLNALAYNPLDNYLYAVVGNPTGSGAYTRGDVVRIGQDGIAESLGKVDGLGSYAAFSATILADGTYVVGRSGEVASLDVTTTPPTLIQALASIPGTAFTDIAVDPTDLTPNRVYFVNESGSSDRINFANPLTHTVEGQLPNPTGTNINAGSQFFDSFGTLYYRSNSNNNLYQVDMDAASPTYGQATLVASAPSGGYHDGTSCAFDIAMEKTVSPASVVAGNTVTYTYRLSNPRSLPVSGLMLTDTMSDGRAFVDGSLVNPLGGTVNAYGGTGTLQISNLLLPVNSVTTITVEVEIPNVTAAGTVDNQAVLSGLNPSLGGTVVSDFPDSPIYPDPTPLTIIAAPTVQVSGTVFEDADHDGVRDGGESGISGVTVVLHNTTYGICDSVQTNASGVYQFPSVVDGSYQIIEAAGETVPNPSSCPAASADPANHVSTTPNTRPVIVSGAALSNQDFGNFNGSRLTGRVFEDNGMGAGTAHDGAVNCDEAGLADIAVSATGHDTAVTSSDGSFTLFVPAAAASVDIVVDNPSGYLSVSKNVGNTGATGPASLDTITFAPVAGSEYSGILFGDAQPPAFAPDQAKAALPGTVIFYPHTFNALTAGAVSFSTSSTSTPGVSGWSHVLFQDSNCNGSFDDGEPPLSGAVNLTAGEAFCLLVKVFVPAAAAIGAQDQLTVTADFTYDNTSPALNSSFSRTDVTTVGPDTTVVLLKSVDKPTAPPGAILTYTLMYQNTGSEAIGHISIQDATPAYTIFIGASCVLPLPLSLTGCVVTTQPAAGATGAVQWTFTGTLAPGGSGAVQYQVRMDQ